jgi:hypothetical protein
VADADSACTEENPDRGPNEVQWQIPFDAAAGVGRAESATEKESATPKINPSATWGDLKTRQSHFECNEENFSPTAG